LVSIEKVKSGDPLVIPAATYNTFIDAARDYLARQQDQAQSARPGARLSGIVLVRNGSGGDRGRFDVLGVAGAVFDPAAGLDAFKNCPALSGVTPSASSHTGRFVILLEPLAAGAIGQAVASGVCIVRVQVDDATLQLADVKNGDATCLKTSRIGSSTILWRQSGTGTVWAVVRLANGIQESSPTTTMFAAKVVSSLGGSAYGVLEQVCTGAGSFADKSGAQQVTAHNLAELSLGPGAAVNTGTIVLAMAIPDTGNPPTTRYVFDHPAYAKYLD
jgi:hypothetical protein